MVKVERDNAERVGEVWLIFFFGSQLGSLSFSLLRIRFHSVLQDHAAK